jgi:predicted CoA-binding protein
MPLAPSEFQELLRSARRIAVVGLSPNPARPSHEVAVYLRSAGYTIVPVRPGVVSVLGEPAYPDLRSATAGGPIDIVDVFRRSETIPDLVDDCLAIRPHLVFLQVGVVHHEAAARLEREGIPVIMNRCLMVDHLTLPER